MDYHARYSIFTTLNYLRSVLGRYVYSSLVKLEGTREIFAVVISVLVIDGGYEGRGYSF